MFKLLSALCASLVLSTVAHASVLSTATSNEAGSVPAFGTFHHRETGFVFVKLPARWAFVAKDADAANYPVFHDAATGFVFVQLSTGWVFVGQAE